MLICLVKKLPCHLQKLPILAVLACLPSISSAQNEAWEKISDPIFEKIPNYEEIPQRLYRRVGGIAVTPENGEIFAVINRDYGVFKSSDHGATWQKLENVPVQGRVYGSFSFSLDAETGRFAVFTQETNRFDIDPVGGRAVAISTGPVRRACSSLGTKAQAGNCSVRRCLVLCMDPILGPTNLR